jgi:uncharacterized membrane protein
MDKQKLVNSVRLTAFAAVFFWVFFVVSLAWSIMSYSYSKIPRDATIEESATVAVAISAIISVVLIMLALYATYRAIKLLGQTTPNRK